MAIDANILLRGIVPDLAGSVQAGLDVGRQIKEGPARTKLLDLQIQRQQSEAQNQAIADGLAQASIVSSAIGNSTQQMLQDPVEFTSVIETLKRANFPVQPQNDPSSDQFTGFESAGGRLFELGALSNRARVNAGVGKRTVQSSTDLGNGLVRMIFNDGSVEVKRPTDDQVSEIKRAQDAVIAFEKRKSSARAGGTVTGRVDAEVETLPDQVQIDLEREEGKALGRATPAVARAQSKLESLKTTARLKAQDAGVLRSTKTGRESSIVKATSFRDALSSGLRSSGVGRQAANFVPIGVWTDQGEFDELFNAFAETAAREKLKASGETRPTDADVQGMKSAIFGLGRSEGANIQLLDEFIADQEALSQKLVDFDAGIEENTQQQRPKFKSKKEELKSLEAELKSLESN